MNAALPLKYDKIIINPFGSVIFKNKSIQCCVPLIKFSRYKDYPAVISNLRCLIGSTKQFITEYDDIKMSPNYNNYFGENEQNTFFLPNVTPYRQMSTHPVPELMRQTSDGMSSSGPMSALRCVSGV